MLNINYFFVFVFHKYLKNVTFQMINKQSLPLPFLFLSFQDKPKNLLMILGVCVSNRTSCINLSNKKHFNAK